jgi:intracellular multiplication protein IcmL
MTATPASATPQSRTQRPPPPKTAGTPDNSRAPGDMGLLKKWIAFQAIVMVGLVLVLVALLPFAAPTYIYFAKNPDGETTRLIGMPMPNMTNRAVLSWATTSITEIMTMGFGDMDVKLPQQRVRFTARGWKAYVKSFIKQKIGETFKQSQLVLTTVPSDTPVIIWQGVNADNVYQWVVQIPVIMTYATNNNVTKKVSSIVGLTIVRVPADESAAGIAIQEWEMY